MTGVHGLIILGNFPRVSTCRNHNSSTTGNQSLQNLRTNTSSTSTGNKNILILKGNTILSSLLKTIQIQPRESLIILPPTLLLLLQMQKRNSLLPSLHKCCIPISSPSSLSPLTLFRLVTSLLL